MTRDEASHQRRRYSSQWLLLAAQSLRNSDFLVTEATLSYFVTARSNEPLGGIFFLKEQDMLHAC